MGTILTYGVYMEIWVLYLHMGSILKYGVSIKYEVCTDMGSVLIWVLYWHMGSTLTYGVCTDMGSILTHGVYTDIWVYIDIRGLH